MCSSELCCVYSCICVHTCTLNYLLWECLEYIDCRFNKRLHKYSGPVVRPSKEPSMANGMSPVFVSQAGETWFCSENSVRSLNDVLNQTRVLRTLPVGCSGVNDCLLWWFSLTNPLHCPPTTCCMMHTGIHQAQWLLTDSGITFLKPDNNLVISKPP